MASNPLKGSIPTEALHAERERVIANLAAFLSRAGQGLALEGFTRVIKKTPVGVGPGAGLARGNWQASIDAPAVGITESSGAVSSRATDALAAFGSMSVIAQFVPGKKFYCVNNLPYIRVLEYGGYPLAPKLGTWVKTYRTSGGKTRAGHYEIRSVGGFSKQAPQGMVGVTMKELKAIRGKIVDAAKRRFGVSLTFVNTQFGRGEI